MVRHHASAQESMQQGNAGQREKLTSDKDFRIGVGLCTFIAEEAPASQLEISFLSPSHILFSPYINWKGVVPCWLLKCFLVYRERKIR